MFLEIKTNNKELKFDLFETTELPLNTEHSPIEGIKIFYEGTVFLPTIKFPETIYISLIVYDPQQLDSFAYWLKEELESQEVQLKIDGEMIAIELTSIEDALKKKTLPYSGI